ncbi:hypothetical protein KI688_007655 [Linnemannia hyalina]|uniref:Uncharacterized protein n=1 Tax=Linnemannia hyalina TaxID=64524 RepID=A0A9P7XH52_9FUNG|nr:hypothetical protein KI688_007655 [Linnemannia hyalina]
MSRPMHLTFPDRQQLHHLVRQVWRSVVEGKESFLPWVETWDLVSVSVLQPCSVQQTPAHSSLYFIDSVFSCVLNKFVSLDAEQTITTTSISKGVDDRSLCPVLLRWYKASGLRPKDTKERKSNEPTSIPR